ncbi:hypothetical protein [Desulfocastanea catecholica]
MKSPVAFLVPVLGCLLGCMVLSATICVADEADRQLLPESFLSQDKQQQRNISLSPMTQQESISADSTNDSMAQEDSSRQIEARMLEGELRKLLLLSCPR